MSTYAKITTPLLELSEATDYENAKLEWRITGKVWRDTEASVRGHPSNHPNHCLCGHNIVYHFEIENTVNKVKEIVGSTCIGNWMILRHMHEQLDIPKDTITEEMIEQWKTQAVTGLIKDAWWEENGDDFKKEFKFLEDFDLRLNVRKGKRYFNRMTGQYEPRVSIRKRAEGQYGHPNYKMASIVWRWNHPDNTRAQRNSTRGYPDDKLLNDMTLFSSHINREMEKIDEHKYFSEHTWIRKKSNVVSSIVDMVEKSLELNRFHDSLRYYDIPIFDPDNAGTSDWETNFLKSIQRQLEDDLDLSSKQLDSLFKIINRNNKTPTEAQTSYLTALGYTGTMPTTHLEISKLIDVWKKKRNNEINGGI